MQNYKESDFEGVYRGENIPIETASRIDKHGDGFMINKPLYQDMIDGISSKEIKKIKGVLFDIINGKTKADFKNELIFIFNKVAKFFGLSLGKIKSKLGVKKQFSKNILIKPTYSNIYNDTNINIDGILGNNPSGHSNDITLIMSIYGKKYFVKKLKDKKYYGFEKPFDHGGINEYKGLEYVEKYIDSNKLENINIIKPIFSMDDHKNHIITYPYINGLMTLGELKGKDQKLYDKIRKDCKNIYDKLKSEGVVGDVRPDNTFIDTKTHKLYIFDPVYNEAQNI